MKIIWEDIGVNLLLVMRVYQHNQK
jgi:hypothetical protein